MAFAIDIFHFICCLFVFEYRLSISAIASMILDLMTRQMGHPSSARASKGECPPASAEVSIGSVSVLLQTHPGSRGEIIRASVKLSVNVVDATRNDVYYQQNYG